MLCKFRRVEKFSVLRIVVDNLLKNVFNNSRERVVCSGKKISVFAILFFIFALNLKKINYGLYKEQTDYP